MKVESHVIIGCATWYTLLYREKAPDSVFSAYASAAPFFFSFGLTALGSILPDLDHPGSAIAHGLILKPLSWGARIAFGHRGFLHSLAMVGIVLAAATATMGPTFALPLTWGYLWHIVADFLTVQGVPLLMPLSDVKLSVPLMAVRTGSFGEALYLGIILVGGTVVALAR